MNGKLEGNLQTHRFLISSESNIFLKILTEDLAQTQKDHPYIKGLGFFGSRTLGLETSQSDLDLCVFYDASDLIVDDSTDMKYLSETSEQADRQYMIQKFYKSKLAQMTGVSEHTVTAVDISILSTQDVLNRFFDNMKYQRQGKAPINYLKISRHTELLVRRFLLGVGDGLYENRESILNFFENRPNGEDNFQHLMGYLQGFERQSSNKRDAILYNYYPKTISQARTFFLTH